jgi:crotonobetainyl-CoA:carnitine CoA-transferase CaiB-like acyl-CoA transferase
VRRLCEIGVRCAPVRDYLEVMQDEGVWANGYLQRFDHPDQGEVTTLGCPIRLSDTPARPGQHAPEIGQHTEEVLLELGLDWDEISALRRARAI